MPGDEFPSGRKLIDGQTEDPIYSNPAMSNGAGGFGCVDFTMDETRAIPPYYQMASGITEWIRVGSRCLSGKKEYFSSQRPPMPGIARKIGNSIRALGSST